MKMVAEGNPYRVNILRGSTWDRTTAGMGDTMKNRRNFLIAWSLIVTVLSAGVFFAWAGTGFANSAAYCDDYARDYANHYANPGGSVLGGAMGGAALGALFGAIAHAPGIGAGIGAGVGALGGGAVSASNWNYLYHRAYNRCMSSGR